MVHVRLLNEPRSILCAGDQADFWRVWAGARLRHSYRRRRSGNRRSADGLSCVSTFVLVSLSSPPSLNLRPGRISRSLTLLSACRTPSRLLLSSPSVLSSSSLYVFSPPPLLLPFALSISSRFISPQSRSVMQRNPELYCQTQWVAMLGQDHSCS